MLENTSSYTSTNNRGVQDASATAAAGSLTSGSTTTGNDSTASAAPLLLREPLLQFGLLVPQSLRDAQRAFGAAVGQGDQCGIARAANLVAEIRLLDGHISRIKAEQEAEREVREAEERRRGLW